MNVRRILMLAVVAAASAGSAGRADAQVGYGCAGGYGGYGWGAWDIGRLYDVLSRNVPYYAAFPPVYYSVPVPRTYGYSPFAYPPGVMTPEVIEVGEPLAIENPYFQGSSAAGIESAPADQTTRVEAKKQAIGGPLLVVNPYVEQSAPALAGR